MKKKAFNNYEWVVQRKCSALLESESRYPFDRILFLDDDFVSGFERELTILSRLEIKRGFRCSIEFFGSLDAASQQRQQVSGAWQVQES